MSTQLATLAYFAGIAGLFWLDRDRGARITKGLWIPTFWLLINGSRPVSVWFQSGPTISQEEQNAEGSPMDAAVYGILILAGMVLLSRRSKKVGPLLQNNLVVLLYFVYCAFSILWSDYSFVATKRLVKAIGDLVMVMIVLTEPDPLMAIKKWLSRAAFLLLPLSILLIKYYPDLGRSYNPWSWVPMYCGVTTFKNLLGMTCLVCGIGSLWSFTGAYRDKQMPLRKRHLIAHGITLVMLVWLLNIANSMTSLSCFAMAGTLILFTNQRSMSSRTKAVHVLLFGSIGLSIFGLFFNPQAMLSGLGRDPTLTGRTEIWRVVLSLHTNPLLGTGFESFWMGDRLQTVWDLTEKGIEEAHNGYLELYLNLGWLGIGLLAAMIAVGYRSALATLRRNPHEGRIRLAFLAAALIYSLTEAGFRMMSPVWIMFLLAVTTVPPRQKQVVTRFPGKSAADLQPPQERVSVPMPIAVGQRPWSHFRSADENPDNHWNMLRSALTI